MINHLCVGLDGANPLHALASCGVLAALEDAGLAVRMHWQRRELWHPVFAADLDRAVLCQRLAEAFLPAEVIVQRQTLDAAEAAVANAAARLEVASAAVNRMGRPGDAAGRAALKAARAEHMSASDALRKAKAVVAEASAAASTDRAVRRLHPVTAAQHLDDIAKGGLSAAALRDVTPGASYLCGLAATIDLSVKVKGGIKKTIARSALSFANNNSGKKLLKDFAGVARFATPERVADALFGDGRLTDAITGLGWDPASQRSYALQFTDPQDLVECQALRHALAFYGLGCFPVVPTARDRATTGFIVMRSGINSASIADTGDAGDAAGPVAGRRTELFQWPVWTVPLSPPAVRSVLAMAEVAAIEPDHGALSARGIAAVFRARRFSLNKRSYFAPGIPA